MRDSRFARYPLIVPGVGVSRKDSGGGAGFHWADVVVEGEAIELWFEGRVCLAVPDGVVEYAAATESTKPADWAAVCDKAGNLKQ
jgi:hypothetical protein